VNTNNLLKGGFEEYHSGKKSVTKFKNERIPVTDNVIFEDLFL